MTNTEYKTLDWHDHAANFPNSFSDLLEKKELVDVTLVADGHLLDAHRLVLSALSPYFRQMFRHVPANQHAFVFMKDVSKQTVEYLMTFIYCGQVSVKQDDLEELLKTAKALKIKGLVDETYLADSFSLSAAPKPTRPKPPQNGLQCQSSQTVQVRKRTVVNSDPAPSNHYHQQQSSSNEQQDNSDFGINTNENSYEMVNNYDKNDCSYGYGMSDDDSSIVSICDAQDDQWDANYYRNSDTYEKNQTKVIPPKAKRVQRTAQVGYNIAANIQRNSNGNYNLFYDNYKFTRGHKGAKTQGWQCSKHTSGMCRAYISTMDIDGIIMMKILNAMHPHAPEI